MRTDLFALATAAYLLKATAVLLLTIIAALALRRAPAGTRHLLWLCSLVLVLALPLLATVLPRWPVLPTPDLARLAAWSAPRGDPRAPDAPMAGWVELRRGDSGEKIVLAPPSTPGSADAEPLPAGAPPAAAGEAARRLDPVFAVIALWLAGTLLILGRLALSALHLRRTLRDGDPLTTPEWTSPLWEAADRLDLSDAPRLLRSERITMPFACGLLRPTIVLPASADEWTPSRRRAVLFHELAHIRRRDLVGHTLGRLACALYWMHPLVWSAARRLRAESERACDDLVLSTGTPASEYADHLLQILVGVRGNDAPAVALPMGRRREFEGRMLAILDPALRRHGPTLAQGAVVGGLALGALLLTAAAPGATTSSEPAGNPAMLQGGAELAWTDPGPKVPAEVASPITAEAPPERPVWHSPAANPTVGHPESTPVGAAQPTVVVEALAEEFGLRVATTVEGFVSDAVSIVFGQNPQGQKNIPLLIRLLARDESPEVRRTAAWGLAEPDRPEAVAALIQALRSDADADVREMAAWALHEVSTPEVVAALRAALRDGSDEVRGRAAWALAHLDARDAGVVEEIAAVLGTADSPDARMMAAWAIGTLHPATTPAPLVAACLRDEIADVRLACAWALGELADSATRPYLLAAFKREADPDALRALTRALALLGPLEEGALEVLLASESPEVRAGAVRIAAGGENAVPPWPWPWPEPRPQP